MPRKIADLPLIDFAPNAAVRERLESPEFRALIDAERTAKTVHEGMSEDAEPVEILRAFDAYKVARHRLEAYKNVTASLLDSPEPAEREFALPMGVERLGEAESGSAEWQAMRQPTLGGSDVGAICKVGEYGSLNYRDCREAKMTLSPSDQEHSGAALRGDLWEPVLIAAAAEVLGQDVAINKATYTDGDRHGNLDGFIAEGERIGHIVECKTSSKPEEWVDTIPGGYILQVQHLSLIQI